MRNVIPGRRRPWRRLLSAVAELAGGRAELLRHTESPWASVTFAGTRHTIVLGFTGAEAVAAGEAFIAALPEHEFAVPGQLVTEATVAAVEHGMAPQTRLKVEVELVLVEEG